MRINRLRDRQSRRTLHIQVRLFNPFSGRGSIHYEFVVNLSRLNHRMHNKVFLMDDAFAVIGGRNIGDDYFGVSAAKNFRDMDLFQLRPAIGGTQHRDRSTD